MIEPQRPRDVRPDDLHQACDIFAEDIFSAAQFRTRAQQLHGSPVGVERRSTLADAVAEPRPVDRRRRRIGQRHAHLVEVGADLVREDGRIAAQLVLLALLSAREHAEEAAASVAARGLEPRNRHHLHVGGIRPRAQHGGERRFVGGGEQGRHQNKVGHPVAESRGRGLHAVDDD